MSILKYDVIIVGMGPSSIFCAYELLKNDSHKKILLIEKGKRIENRICPIAKSGKCLKCKPICNIIGGFSGAGAFSDGKLLSYHLSSYNEKNEDMYMGGKDNSFIKEYFTNDEIKKCMQYVDDIYLKFGASKKLEGIDNKSKIKRLARKAKKEKLELIDVPIRHLGTEKAHELFKRIQDYLEDKLTLLFETEVKDLVVNGKKVEGVITKDTTYYANKIILAVGVDGAKWVEELANKYSIRRRNSGIDIGIRYELPDKVMNEVNELMYESKFIGYTDDYHDKVRTYCQNPSGFVTPETYDNGLTLVNGHSYKYKKSNNTNLAILTTYNFEKPFASPINYNFNVAEKANMFTGGTVVVQRFGDLINKKATTKEDLKHNSVNPTMKSAFPFDLATILDYRTITNIIDFIKKVDKVIPGFANEDNLMYGPEIKFYGNELIVNKNLETSLKNLYSIGTGGGLTIGLMWASVSGVLLARKLGKEK